MHDRRQAYVLLQAFYADHPEELVWLDVVESPGHPEPELWFPPQSCQKFPAWVVAKGYGDCQVAQELSEAIARHVAERQAHMSGICQAETCHICQAQSGAG